MNKEKPTPDSVDLSLEEKLNEITRQIEKIIDSHSTILNPEPLQNLIVQLKEQVSDVVAVEEKMNSIRREITEPVKSEIEKTSNPEIS